MTHSLTRPAPRLLAAALVALTLGAAVAPAPVLAQQGPRGANAHPRQVGTVTAGVRDVPQIVTLPGRAVAYEVATVRPRVGGLVEAIAYEPGRPIEAGAPMFRLETATLNAALDSARAAEQGASLARDNAQATVTRYRALENKGVSRADLQAAEVALSQAEAALVQARTERQTAALELDRAVIAAPISGVTSETAATIGSLVTANQADALATVTRVDPVYVDVAASSSQVLRSRQKIREGLMTPMRPPGLALTLEDGTRYDSAGEVVSTGATVSATTGTVDLRLKFANPDRMILPGQFLRVQMTLGTIRAVLVPQRATTRLADGSLAVFVLAEGNRAHRVMLTEQGVWNNAWAVTEGVAEGDRIIVDGLSNLQDGQRVEAVEVTLDENGVVVATPGAQDQSGVAAGRQPGARATDAGRPLAAADAAGASGTPASGAPASGTPASETAQPAGAPAQGWRGWIARAQATLGMDGGDAAPVAPATNAPRATPADPPPAAAPAAPSVSTAPASPTAPATATAPAAPTAPAGAPSAPTGALTAPAAAPTAPAVTPSSPPTPAAPSAARG